MQGRRRVDDGKIHTVGVQFRNGKYELTVDGTVDGKGLQAVPDHPETKVVVGVAIGHTMSNGVANGDKAPKCIGEVDSICYNGRMCYVTSSEQVRRGLG